MSITKNWSYTSVGSEKPLIGSPIYPFLREVALANAQGEAIVSIPQNIRLTYAALFAEVDRLARGLVALGISRGTRVGIWSTNNVEWVLLQVATARLGAVLVNINPAYRTVELEHALKSAEVECLFLMPSFRRSRYLQMVCELCPEAETASFDALSCARLPGLSRLVLFEPRDASGRSGQSGVTAVPSGALTWQQVLDRGRQVKTAEMDSRTASVEFDDPINIQFTSGTTGFAKPVVLTHHNLLNNAFFVGLELKFGNADRLCVPVPFYHCFGMVLSNLLCLSHGATLVIPAPHFDPEATLAAIENERCTALHGVPTMFVAELESATKYDLRSLRTGIMAGAPCPSELMRKVIDEIGCHEILIAYGQTEASPVTHITRATDSFERRVATVGTNLPHQEVKVVDPDNGSIVPIGTPGELCFRGYHVMRGYYRDETATRQAIDPAGWLHSGDLGVMDEDGYVCITGRLKDMIIRGGENIYPAEIEACLAAHPKVAQVSVFGIRDEKWGEEVGAWIQLRAGEMAEPEELRAWATRNLAHFKVPRWVKIVDEFPMTVTGKIQKFRIQEIVERELSALASGD